MPERFLYAAIHACTFFTSSSADAPPAAGAAVAAVAAAAGAIPPAPSAPSPLFPPATAIPATATSTNPPSTTALLLPPSSLFFAAALGALAGVDAYDAKLPTDSPVAALGSLIVGASAGSSLPLIDGRGVGASTALAGASATGALLFSGLGASTAGEEVSDGSAAPPRALTAARSSSW